MKSTSYDYQERVNEFQQRLEELAIEKELLLNRVFVANERLKEVKGKVVKVNSEPEKNLVKSLSTIENHIYC